MIDPWQETTIVERGESISIVRHEHKHRAPLPTSHQSWKKMLLADAPLKVELYDQTPRDNNDLHPRHELSVEPRPQFWYDNKFTAASMSDIAEALKDLEEHWVMRRGRLSKRK